MTDRIIAVLIGLYILGIVLTFGYASNEIGKDIPDPIKRSEPAVIGGALVAILWPLYLSHKAFERKSP